MLPSTQVLAVEALQLALHNQEDILRQIFRVGTGSSQRTTPAMHHLEPDAFPGITNIVSPSSKTTKPRRGTAIADGIGRPSVQRHALAAVYAYGESSARDAAPAASNCKMVTSIDHLVGHAKVIYMVKKNVAEAKAQLSALLDMAHDGQEILVCKSGIPWARIVPPLATEPRRPGAWRGLLSEKVLAALEAPLVEEEVDEWHK